MQVNVTYNSIISQKCLCEVLLRFIIYLRYGCLTQSMILFITLMLGCARDEEADLTQSVIFMLPGSAKGL